MKIPDGQPVIEMTAPVNLVPYILGEPIPAGITVDETTGKEWYVVVLKINGQTFNTTWPVREDRPDDQEYLAFHRRCSLKDLQWFINEFYFFGCGGPNHKFTRLLEGEGDPSNRWSLYECEACGAIKKMNMNYPACVKEWVRDAA